MSVNCVVSGTFLLNVFVKLGPARNSQSCNQRKVDKKSNLQVRVQYTVDKSRRFVITV